MKLDAEMLAYLQSDCPDVPSKYYSLYLQGYELPKIEAYHLLASSGDIQRENIEVAGAVYVCGTARLSAWAIKALHVVAKNRYMLTANSIESHGTIVANGLAFIYAKIAKAGDYITASEGATITIKA